MGGSIAQRPGVGGHTWALLQHVLGWRELGWRVLLVDRLDDDMGVEAGVRYLRDVMARFGLDGDWALLRPGTGETVGLERAELLRRARAADAIVNVMGFVTDDEVLAAPRRRVFLDIDPGFWQMWGELGLHDGLRGHDVYATVGERIGAPGCAIPTRGIDWVTTRPPVALSHWPVAPDPGTAWSTVGAWRGPYDPVELHGTRYGLRVHEFRALLDLPRRTAERFEAALDLDPGDEADRARLVAHGWRLRDPRAVARDPWAYRRYLAAAKGELGVAKEMYVRSRSGWFSDRSAAYLASGRPVVAQDTGFSERLPTGLGLLAFDDLDGAVAGVEAVAGDHARHARAAREVAEAHLAAGVVLPRLAAAWG